MPCLWSLLEDFVYFTRASLSRLDGDEVVIENGTFSWSADGPPCLKRYVVRMQ